MFEWHFTIRGPPDTEFEGGIYHGRIILPSDYPLKPPSIIVLTVYIFIIYQLAKRKIWNKKENMFEYILISSWIVATSMGKYVIIYLPNYLYIVRTILEAIISFLPTPGEGAIGSLDYPAEERKRLAKLSVDYECPKCGKVSELLPPLNKDEFKLTYGNVINELSAAAPTVVDESVLKEHDEEVDENEEIIINKEDKSFPSSSSTPSPSDITPNPTTSPESSQPPPPIPSTTSENELESNKSELRHRNVNSSLSNTNIPTPTSNSNLQLPEVQNHHAQQFVQQLNENQNNHLQNNGVAVNDSSIIDQLLTYIIYLFYVIIALILLKKTSKKFF